MKNMDKSMMKKLVKTIGITVGIPLLLSALMVFPVLNFHGTRIPLFAAARIVTYNRFTGRVLGDRVLETEYGEIRLQHLSQVLGENNTLVRVDFREFEEGRASHNLVVHGIEIPPNVSIAFDDFDRVSIIVMHGSTIDRQEIIVSGIPVMATRISLGSKEGWDIFIGGGGGHITGAIITLADSTQILSGERSYRRLWIYQADERWRMLDTSYSILVKLPGEEEFTRYRAITFRPDWGEFIEGELWGDREIEK